MQLTVLVDNNTLTDRYLLGEPGLSLFLEVDGCRLLFDCGYSDILRVNAGRLGLDLRRLDVVALSHGHLDHTWGLAALLALYAEQAAEGIAVSRPRLIAHPEALTPKRLAGHGGIGSILAPSALEGAFQVELTRQAMRLTDRLFFLGEIPRAFDFEVTPPLGQRQSAAGFVPDTLVDDTALAYLGETGLVIVTGCSHAGICNIVEHARDVTGERRVAAIFGGLHLLSPPDPVRLAATVDTLRAAGVAELYPCHCTGLTAKIALGRVATVHEVGVGLRVCFA